MKSCYIITMHDIMFVTGGPRVAVRCSVHWPLQSFILSYDSIGAVDSGKDHPRLC